MKLCYAASHYRSHRRTADAYLDLLRDKCELVPQREWMSADVIVLHREPNEIEANYRAHPDLVNRYVIGVCVWEASDLPDTYKSAIQHLQEVWTCSRYCQQAFSKYHPAVHQVPHLVARDTTCSQEHIDFVKRAIGYDPARRFYVTIARGWDGHKNARGLVRAFERQCRRMPNARLVVKVDEGREPGAFSDPRILWIAENWSDEQINALYRLADVYASAHHGEGWGLTMSDAMLFGKPVIATGYSGNMEFMTPDNAVLVDFEEREIREEDQYALYRRPMKWAYPSERDLEAKLSLVYDAFDTEWMAERVRRASAALRRFDRQSVAAVLDTRLHSTMEALRAMA